MGTSFLPNTEIAYYLKDNSTGETEVTPILLDGNKYTYYQWPAYVADGINGKSSGVELAGEYDTESKDIVVIYGSSYRNSIWLNNKIYKTHTASYEITDFPREELELIRRRIEESAAHGYEKDQNVIDGWIAKQNADGSFSDLNYPASGSTIPTDQLTLIDSHFSHLQSIAVWFKNTKQTNYLTSTNNGIDFYIDQNYDFENWWNLMIKYPRSIANIIIFISNHTSNSYTKKFTDYNYTTADINNKSKTAGANGLDLSNINIITSFYGMLSTTDPFDMGVHTQKNATALALVNSLSQMVVAPEEGPQVDNSFTQHNPTDSNGVTRVQLYLSYGSVFINDACSIVSFVMDTRYSLLLPDVTENLGNYLTKAFGWMMYQGLMAMDSMGRAVSRGMITSGSYSNPVNILLKAGYSGKNNLLELQNRIDNTDETQNSYYLGVRGFPVCDYSSYISPAMFCTTLRMVSMRTVGSESGNGEGLKNYYLGSGTCFSIASGKEYYDIPPVWDWEKLPGSTNEAGLYTDDLPLINWGNNDGGTHDFVGTVTDEQCSLSSMIITKSNLADAYESYLMYNDTVLCIGSNITNSDNLNFITTVDQLIWDGTDVTISVDNEEDVTVKLGEKRTITEPASIRYGNRIYKSLIPQNMHIEIATQSGSWSEINSGKSTDEIEKNVLSIYITHKSQMNSYLYSVQPIESTLSKSTQFVTKTDTINSQFIQNPDTFDSFLSVHIIVDANTPSYAIDSGDIMLKPISPLMLMSRVTQEGTIDIAVADITQLQDEIIFTVSGHYYNEQYAPDGSYDGSQTRVTVDAAALDIKGESITFKLTKN